MTHKNINTTGTCVAARRLETDHESTVACVHVHVFVHVRLHVQYKALSQ